MQTHPTPGSTFPVAARRGGNQGTSSQELSQLSDKELLESTRALVGRSNQLFAALLLHLAEVETRGLHRVRSCPSLYTYCIYELRMSEDAAFRRVSAARWVKRFPALFDAVQRGELHLTGLLMLGPHLTEANHLQVLAQSKYRTKKELKRLVRQLAPLEEETASVEPLGPAPARGVSYNPSWEEFVHSFNPVRELRVGARPHDWTHGKAITWEPALASQSDSESGDSQPDAPARDDHQLGDDQRRSSSPIGDPLPADQPTSAPIGDPLRADQPTSGQSDELRDAGRGRDDDTAQARDLGGNEQSGSALGDQVSDTVPVRQRYRVQFTANEEYVQLLEQAKALLSHAVPRGELEEIHLRAMRVLVAELVKRKYGAGRQTERAVTKSEHRSSETPPVSAPRPTNASSKSTSSLGTAAHDEARTATHDSVVHDEARTATHDSVVHDEARAATHDSVVREAVANRTPSGPATERARSRAIPRGVRHAVYQRDQGRCSYVDAETGQRCRERGFLELHHVTPFARGGEHSAANLTLRCRAHNTLAAEQDFGRERVEQKRDALRHESFAERKQPGVSQRR